MKKFNLEDIPSLLVYLIFKVERIETLLRNRTSEGAGESGKCRTKGTFQAKAKLSFSKEEGGYDETRS